MFNLDQDKLHQAEAGVGTTEGSLPFEAPVFYVVNGKPNAGADNPVLKFGGWATDVEKMDQIVANTNRVLPPQLKKGTSTTNEGKVIESYFTRALVLSVATFRISWLAKNNKERYPDYRENTRRHVQALAIMAVPNKTSGLEIWGPVILSAKGFQAKKLLACLDDWSKHTSVIRAQQAPGIPAFMFYSAVGTFGDQPIFERVGQGSQVNNITPIGVRKTDITVETLQKIYGGDPLLDAISTVQDGSKQWVSAWNVASKANVASDSLPEEGAEEYPY
jgi:hypothetical protein